MNQELLKATLDIGVMTAFDDFRKYGIPELTDKQRSELADYLGAHGDSIFFSDKHTARATIKFIEAVSLLATQIGGVTVFGQHYEYTEAKAMDTSEDIYTMRQESWTCPCCETSEPTCTDATCAGCNRVICTSCANWRSTGDGEYESLCPDCWAREEAQQ